MIQPWYMYMYKQKTVVISRVNDDTLRRARGEEVFPNDDVYDNTIHGNILHACYYVAEFQ